jgi:hypothetical protein
MTELRLVIENAAESVLDRNKTLYKATNGFFQFWRSLQVSDDRQMLGDGVFLNVHIPMYVKNWPHQTGPPHPGVFSDVFPALLNQLVGASGILTLHVKSVDPEYFDELAFIKDIAAPRGLQYVLLPTRTAPTRGVDFGNILFEWPLESLKYIVENWFMSPQVSIEGYVTLSSRLGTLAELYFRPSDARTIRKLLEAVEFGFTLWPDNNGIFILSDKLDEDALRKRLASPDLDDAIKAAISAAQHGL